MIAGGESGPVRRPVAPEWVRSIRDQCIRAQVPFFFKQLGEYTWSHDGSFMREPDLWVCTDGRTPADEKLELFHTAEAEAYVAREKRVEMAREGVLESWRAILSNPAQARIVAGGARTRFRTAVHSWFPSYRHWPQHCVIHWRGTEIAHRGFSSRAQHLRGLAPGQ